MYLPVLSALRSNYIKLYNFIIRMIEAKSANFENFHTLPRCSKCKAIMNLDYIQFIEFYIETNRSVALWRKYSMIGNLIGLSKFIITKYRPSICCKEYKSIKVDNTHVCLKCNKASISHLLKGSATLSNLQHSIGIVIQRRRLY